MMRALRRRTGLDQSMGSKPISMSGRMLRTPSILPSTMRMVLAHPAQWICWTVIVVLVTIVSLDSQAVFGAVTSR